ncbi:MAG: hypothetical protein PHN69_05020 [Candidatus Pacebacteria bacterium]|nr:hypothetical protein [Candidatus Paceibacterota bacterium]
MVEMTHVIHIKGEVNFNEFTDYVTAQIKEHYKMMNEVCDYGIEEYTVTPDTIKIKGFSI